MADFTEPGRFTPGARPGEPGYDPGFGAQRPNPLPYVPRAIAGEPGYDPGTGTVRPAQGFAVPTIAIPPPAADQPHAKGQADDPKTTRK